MTSHGDYSPEAKDAAEGKARAAGVFADNAEIIVAELGDAPDDHVLVSVVDFDHAFSGSYYVAQDEIVARVPELEERGWVMVFTPGTDVDGVRRRTDEMATLARRRAEMITRIRTRRT